MVATAWQNSNNGHLAATFGNFDSLMGVRQIAVAAISVLALLFVAAGASAARAHKKVPAMCVRGHSRLIAADSQAQLYVAAQPHALPEFLGVYGCVYGRKPVFFGPLPYGSSQGAGGVAQEVLTGSFAAYEESSIGGAGSNRAERRVVVRDLRTGKVLHKVPTGMPAVPKAEDVGIGNVFAIVLKSDGAVAWIAGDGSVRSASDPSSSVLAFQLVAVDASGTRLLASGIGIDPSSLALSVTATNVGQGSLTVPGGTLYWTQGGKSLSVSLN
jgi:hypothetical protein